MAGDSTGLMGQWRYHARSLGLMTGFLTGRFFHANLQLTYRCGCRCRICDFWKTPPDPAYRESEPSLDDIRVIGQKLRRLGTMILSLAGGEPLERADLADIVRILRDAGHFPILITNGQHVDEARARELGEAGLQEISVSVDYADAARHDAQRGCPGLFDRAVRALELLHKHRVHKRNRVHMISVLMDDNLEDIEPLIRLARDLGVTYMINLYSWNRGEKARRLPAPGVTAHLLDLKKRYPEFVTLTSYIERIDEALEKGGIGDCQAGRLLMNIDPRGNVARCTETLGDPVGNILTDDIFEIRSRLLEKRRAHDCAQCWTSCRGFAESMRRPPRLRQLREFLISVKPR